VIESIAAVVTAIGVVFAGVQLRAGQLQRNRQFEILYVERYWSLMDELSLAALRGRGKFEDLSEKDRNILEMYVRLCEDQLEMQAAQAITSWTYEQWRSGMLAARKQGHIEKSIESVTSDKNTPCGHLQSLLKDKEYDPLKLGPVRRWIRGLS
jgi:hypothetical protein